LYPLHTGGKKQADLVATLWARCIGDLRSPAIMPWLAKDKRRPSASTGSAALRADAAESALCACLSVIALAGLAVQCSSLLLFQRLGLQRVEHSISEVEWPAPSHSAGPFRNHPARVTMLFALRPLSKAVPALNSKHWGNRYFYAGRWQGVECSVGKSA